MATKVLKNLTYVERCKKFISQMQESNWITIDDTTTLTKLQFNLNENLWRTTLTGIDWFNELANEDKNMYLLGELEEENDVVMIAFLGNDFRQISGPGGVEGYFPNNSLMIEVNIPMNYMVVSLLRDYTGEGEGTEMLPIYYHGPEEIGFKEGFQDEFLENVDAEGNLDLSQVLGGTFYSADVENGNLFDKYINGILIGE